jgi:hypothetical protein
MVVEDCWWLLRAVDGCSFLTSPRFVITAYITDVHRLVGYTWMPRLVVLSGLDAAVTNEQVIAAVEAAGLVISVHSRGNKESQIVQREVVEEIGERDEEGSSSDEEGPAIVPTTTKKKRKKKFAPLVYIDSEGVPRVRAVVQMATEPQQKLAIQSILTINGVSVHPELVVDEPIANTREEIDIAFAQAANINRQAASYLYLGCVVDPRPGAVEEETCAIATTSRYMQWIDIANHFAVEMARAAQLGAQFVFQQADGDGRYVHIAEFMVLFELRQQPMPRSASLLSEKNAEFKKMCASFGNPVSPRFTDEEFDMFVSVPAELRRPKNVSARRKLPADASVPFDDRFEPVAFFIGIRLLFIIGFAPLMGGVARLFGSDSYHWLRKFVNKAVSDVSRTQRLGNIYVLF